MLEVIEAVIESGNTRSFVDIHTTFTRPEPLLANAAGEEESIR